MAKSIATKMLFMVMIRSFTFHYLMKAKSNGTEIQSWILRKGKGLMNSRPSVNISINHQASNRMIEIDEIGPPGFLSIDQDIKEGKPIMMIITIINKGPNLTKLTEAWPMTSCLDDIDSQNQYPMNYNKNGLI